MKHNSIITWIAVVVMALFAFRGGNIDEGQETGNNGVRTTILKMNTDKNIDGTLKD